MSHPLCYPLMNTFLKSNSTEENMILQSSLGLGIGAGAMLVYLFFAFILYFIPSFVAYKVHHRQFTAIFILNICTAWTFIGWVGALVWALIQGENQGRRDARRRYSSPSNSHRRTLRRIRR